MRRTKAEALQTREKILDTALLLFDELGYSKTSLSAVAKQAGMTRGAIYWHFQNKEEILNALAEREFAEIIDKNSQALQAANTWEQLTDNFVSFFGALNHHPQRARFFRIGYFQRGSDEALISLNRRMDNHWEEQCRRAVEQGHRNGELRPGVEPDYIFYHLSATISGLIKLYFEQSDRCRFERFAGPIIRNTIALFKR